MYSFRAIRTAILNSVRQPGFPYEGRLASEHLPALREAAHLQTFLSDVRADAQAARETPITTLSFGTFKLFSEVGSRREFEQPYFARRARLLALTLDAAIFEQDASLPALEDLIWAICDEYTWCLPAHLWRDAPSPRGARLKPPQMVDLFAAETAHALAEVVTMLGERLHPWIHERVRVEIEQRVFRPIFHDPIHFHWESVPMNWASVCAGASGMAALLLEDDPERLAGMIERACRAMEAFMEGFAPDGGCAEGIGYWQYGFGYYVYFAEMLREYTGGALDLLDSDLARTVAAFPAGVSLGGTSFINYSDGPASTRMHPGILSRLHARFGTPVPELPHPPGLHNDHAYRWPHVTRDLLWTDPQIFGRTTPTGSHMFADLGWVVDRRSADGLMLAFSARGGHNGEPHNQNDLGHFILHVGGDTLLADLGAGLYTRQYFGPQRYEHIHNSSEGHSVPIIDGQAQQPGEQYHARVLHYAADDHGTTFELDLTHAYAIEQLERYTRRFVWSFDESQQQATLTIHDQFDFGRAPGALEEIFISLHPPELATGHVVWNGTGGSVTLTFDQEQFESRLESIASQDHQANPITVQRVRLQARHPAEHMDCELVFRCVKK